MINQIINIWDHYEYKGKKEEGFQAKLTTYILSGEKPRGLVLILPGGGYRFTSPREAEPIALKFNSAGYHAVVLDYSCAPNRFPIGLYDCARTLTIIKENKELWKVNLDKIYVCGFSAGGHLAASISNMYLQGRFESIDGINLDGIKLRGTILAYPVLTANEYRHKGSFDNLLGTKVSEEERMNHAMEDLVSQTTPETFVWHTVEDQAVPVENTLRYITALQKKNIPFECHIYPKGLHGLSLANKETADENHQVNKHVASWMGLCLEWLDSHL